VDVIAFFILRTATDRTNTVSQDELALIPFPVDELFSEHLSSFDAVVLQDFDAQPYGLERHLPALTRYVKAGGGLIMVGGPNSFVAGGYGGTPLAEVLPVSLDNSPGATAADPSPFVPQWTDSGMTAPLLGPLRAAVQGELPTMPGANILGEVRRGSVALWTHPTRRTKTGAPMPVLAVGDHGDGRSIALGVDGGWLLQFSSLGSRTSGRGHAAMWDGLLGWLMRDPRYEPAQVELLGGCTAGMASTLRVSFLAEGTSEKGSAAALELYRLDGLNTRVFGAEAQPTAGSRSVELPLPALDPGGYTARIRIANGQTTRLDFACEAGGDEWADPRPDAERMQRLAALSGGTFRYADENLDRIPMPKPTVVSAERRTVPLAPPWVWAMGAILSLGSHWMIRRRSGLS
jgi:uncharacterized membrane protein